MKTKLMKLGRLLGGAAIVAMLASPSCTTTYDAYGRPVQSVDPGTAAAGAAAAGVLGYAIGREHDDGHHYHHRRYYRRY
jgi:hypothetical protein